MRSLRIYDPAGDLFPSSATLEGRRMDQEDRWQYPYQLVMTKTANPIEIDKDLQRRLTPQHRRFGPYSRDFFIPKLVKMPFLRFRHWRLSQSSSTFLIVVAQRSLCTTILRATTGLAADSPNSP